MLQKTIFFCLAAQVWAAASSVRAAAEQLQLPATVTEPMRLTAMPELDNSTIGKALSRYYSIGLGGPEVFAGLESFKISGTLTASGKDFQLSALQKKPGSLKMSIKEPDSRSTIELAYDGTRAWRRLPRAEPEVMTEEEGRRFAHSAGFGSHLLYPYAEGKRIELVDTVPVEGTICHHFRVTMDSGYQVEYFLDIRTLLETKVVSTDLRSGFVNTILYRNYTRQAGWPIAGITENFENGERVSLLKIDSVQINTGVMPWMFRMP